MSFWGEEGVYILAQKCKQMTPFFGGGIQICFLKWGGGGQNFLEKMVVGFEMEDQNNGMWGGDG